MRSAEFRQTRQLLRITQDQLAERLRTTRRSIIRYEDMKMGAVAPWDGRSGITTPRLGSNFSGVSFWRVLWTTGRRCVYHENGC
jgi:hypothetical protein